MGTPRAGRHLMGGSLKEPSQVVETLFETQTVVEIQEVETKTRADIEEKKKQLRSLVGSSYRDMIASADTILAMATSCDTVLSNIKQIKAGLGSLADQSASGQHVQKAGQHASKTKTLHAVGGRIKYLIDTPEIIWGYLDTHEYLEAARRYLQAAEVYKLLTKTVPSELKSRFPLVNNQWPNIQKFRGQIIDQVNQRLNQPEMLSAQEAATALGAAAYLQNLTSAQALELLLGSRQRAVHRLLTEAASKEPEHAGQNAVAVLREVLRFVQDTVWQVGRLVLSEHGSEQQALLCSLLETDAFTSQITFSPLSNGTDGASEDESWQAFSNEVKQRLQPLKRDATAAAVTAFLGSLHTHFQSEGRQFLAQNCQSADDLASVEKQLRQLIVSWKHTEAGQVEESSLLSPKADAVAGTPRISTKLDSLLPTPRAAGNPPSAFTKRSFALDEPRAALPQDWPATCDWVAAKNLDLWHTLLEQVFIQIGKDLIRRDMTRLEADLQSSIGVCIEDARSMPEAPPGSFRADSWPEQPVGRASIGGKEGPALEVSLLQDDPPGKTIKAWRGQLQSIQQDFDGRLQKILGDTLTLLTDQSQVGKERQLRKMYSGRSFAAPPAPATARAAALRPFLQESCQAFAEALVANLSSRLQEALPGRLCLAFSSPDLVLPIILGPPENWQSALAPKESGSFAAPKPQAKSQQPGRFAELQQKFRQIAEEAHKMWGGWLSATLGQEFQHALRNDATLTSQTRLRVWQETVVKQDDGAEESAEETRFFLPAMPTAGSMMLLLAAGRELQRAGGHQRGSSALHILKQNLAQAALDAFRVTVQTLSESEAGMTEPGILQLLFDTRFLRDILLGQKPASAYGSAARGSREKLAGLMKEFADLEERLQERLDPIDWAIYASYLWQNEASMVQRVRVLYGSLLHSSTAQSEVLSRGVVLTEANIMSLPPTSSRFAYLPISMPSATAAQPQYVSSVITQLGPDGSGEEENYSFARLGTLKTEADLRSGEDVVTSATESSDVAQSRTAQRLGVLGSLLGDRAAEVTAMAQQSFSDISLPSAFTTALGNPSSGASGLFSSFRGLRDTGQ